MNGVGARPSVSVIVPCRNEVDHVDAFLDAVLAQHGAPDGAALQVLVADGRSDDGTTERLRQRAAADPRLTLVDNPERIVSTALNRAIARALGDIIVRMDVHTHYAPDYIACSVAALRRTGATCVGGAWRPVGRGWPQAAIAAAFASRFGSGGAASRRVELDGEVDTVYLGAWRRDELLALGGFDEALVRNQDDELNLRIRRRGGRVWQSAAIRSWYTPRGSFAALFRQFHQYGYWKVPVIRKHRLPASLRHLVPFLFVLVLALLMVVSVSGWLWPWPAVALQALLALYVSAALANAWPLAQGSVRQAFGIAFSFACMHIGYGMGFGRALVDFVLLRRQPGSAMTRLTR